MLNRLIAIGISGFLLYKGALLAKDQVGFIANITKAATSQAEVNGLKKQIYIDLVIEDGAIPAKHPYWWTEYIRNNMQSDDPDRDTSKDMWGTPFQINELRHIPGKPNGGFEVRSAGVDGKFGTKDDIVAQCAYD